MEIYNRSKRVFNVDPKYAPGGEIKPGVSTNVNDAFAEKLLKVYKKELVAFKGKKEVTNLEKQIEALSQELTEVKKANLALEDKNIQLQKELENLKSQPKPKREPKEKKG